MKRLVIFLSVLGFSFVPLAASAHEHAIFKIGNGTYQFVVGSLNEPVAVDDKTGVDLTVQKCTSASCAPSMSMDGDMDGPAGTPLAGLEKTLKVELSAGDQKKVLALSPVYGKPGSYSAAFYPTVQTSYTYRFTGQVDGMPVDLSFTCLPEGTAKSADVTDAVKITDQVTQLSRGGGFGCPLGKESLGFPKPSATNTGLNTDAAHARMLALVALALAAVSLILSGFSRFRKK